MNKVYLESLDLTPGIICQDRKYNDRYICEYLLIQGEILVNSNI